MCSGKMHGPDSLTPKLTSVRLPSVLIHGLTPGFWPRETLVLLLIRKYLTIWEFRWKNACLYFIKIRNSKSIGSFNTRLTDAWSVLDQPNEEQLVKYGPFKRLQHYFGLINNISQKPFEGFKTIFGRKFISFWCPSCIVWIFFLF